MPQKRSACECLKNSQLFRQAEDPESLRADNGHGRGHSSVAPARQLAQSRVWAGELAAIQRRGGDRVSEQIQGCSAGLRWCDLPPFVRKDAMLSRSISGKALAALQIHCQCRFGRTAMGCLARFYQTLSQGPPARFPASVLLLTAAATSLTNSHTLPLRSTRTHTDM
jgi:hypothetical protein